jgi:hypothetical protein
MPLFISTEHMPLSPWIVQNNGREEKYQRPSPQHSKQEGPLELVLLTKSRKVLADLLPDCNADRKENDA